MLDRIRSRPAFATRGSAWPYLHVRAARHNAEERLFNGQDPGELLQLPKAPSLDEGPRRPARPRRAQRMGRAPDPGTTPRATVTLNAGPRVVRPGSRSASRSVAS